MSGQNLSRHNARVAEEYARHGYAVFPLIPLTKKPATTHGFMDATTDIHQVRAWWRENPRYNIGISCGASDLVVIDFDPQNDAPPVDSLFDEDDLRYAIIVDTPSGGSHLYFRKPAGVDINSSTNKVRQGVDVRARGGYVVASPSYLDDPTTKNYPAKGFGPYSLRPDHKFSDVSPTELAILSGEVRELATAQPRAASTTSAPVETPTLSRLADALNHIDPNDIDYNTWQGIIAAIHDTVGVDALGAVINWADGKPGEVEKKWNSYDRPYSGPKRTLLSVYYLARKGGWVDPTCVADTTLDLTGLREWVGSPACLSLLKKRGIARPTGLIETLGHLVRLAHDRNSHKVYVSCRELANMIGSSAMSISRRLQKMEETNIVTLTTQGQGQMVDFTPILLDPSVTVFIATQEMGEGVTLRSSEFWGQHTGDDAFKSYPYAYAVKRRMENKSPLMTSLGATGYLLWPRLEQGGTIKELAESGLSVATVRASVKKYLSCGLLEVDESDRQKSYRLIDNAEEMLDEIRPHMTTAFVGQMRVGRNHGETATYAAFKLRQRKKMEKRDVLWWENLRDDADRRAAIIFESLKEQGYDATKKVGKEKEIRSRRRFDYGEEWRTWGRPLFDAYNALGDMPDSQRAHSLTLSIVPKDAGEEQFHAALLEMRERLRMVRMMAPKRATYERTLPEEEESFVSHNHIQNQMRLVPASPREGAFA